MKLKPAYAEAYWRRALCCYVMKYWARAVADFERAAKLNPNAVPRFKRYWDGAKRELAKETDF